MPDGWLLSVVVPVYNEEETVSLTFDKLETELGWVPRLEYVFVDDGSNDKSFAQLTEIAARNPKAKVVRLSRNFGHETAIAAGLRWARGDAVVLLDADLQDPPELIKQFVNLWLQGYDVVYGIRQTRAGEPWLKQQTSKLFYRTLARLSDVVIPMDVGDFRLMSRRVVEVLNSMPESRRFFRGMAAWVGFRQVGVPYHRRPRAAGKSHYSLGRLWRLSVDAIVGFSSQPLRWASRVGSLLGLAGILWATHIVIKKLLLPHSALIGWSSLMSVILVVGGLQLILVGLVGEYIASILEQVRSRPLFVVEQVLNAEDSGRLVMWPEAPRARGVREDAW